MIPPGSGQSAWQAEQRRLLAGAVPSEPTAESDDTFIPDSFEPEDYPAPPKVERAASERGRTGPSQSTELVQLARALYTVVRGDDSKIYAFARTLPGIAFGLRGERGLRAQLAAAYFDDKGRAANGSALTDALTVIEGDAFQAPETRVQIRVGMHGENVIIDLGTPDARAVEVGSAGWRVVARSPILFRRSKATLAMPTPAVDGSLDQFRALLNVDQARFRLIVGWVIAALVPDIPHPILTLTGQQGTAKTTAAGLVLSLIDPSPASMQSQPRSEEDWAVVGHNVYGIGIDNVSKIPGWFQDALCKAVTGAALMGRERYSDDSISILRFRRPIVLTTIDPGSLQGDVADRLLLVQLDPIPQAQRRTDAELAVAADQIRATTLGAILDMLSKVLAVLPSVQLGSKPRMADFAEVLSALDQVTGWDTLSDYLTSTTTAAQDVIDGDAFGTALVRLVIEKGPWEGTCMQLLEQLSESKHPTDWPKNPAAVAGKLKRLTPALASVDVTVRRHDARSNLGWHYTIAPRTTSGTLCATCGQAMSDVLVRGNYTTHPSCEPLDESELI